MNKKNTTIQKLKIKYSVDLETQRVFDMIKRIEWFNKMGYKINLPEKIKLMNLDKVVKLTTKDIKKIIAEEYKLQDYQKTESIIEKTWNNISAELSKKLSIINLKYKSSYILILTKYGTGGSYNLPNKIILNFNKKTPDRIIRIIIHEIIHLSIQSLIEKFKIDHWIKERIVDLMMFKVMPELAKMQNIPQNTEKIDKLFKNFFPDVEKIIKEYSLL